MGDYNHMEETALRTQEQNLSDQVKFKHTITSLDAADETDEVNNENEVQTATLGLIKGHSTYT